MHTYTEKEIEALIENYSKRLLGKLVVVVSTGGSHGSTLVGTETSYYAYNKEIKNINDNHKFAGFVGSILGMVVSLEPSWECLPMHYSESHHGGRDGIVAVVLVGETMVLAWADCLGPVTKDHVIS